MATWLAVAPCAIAGHLETVGFVDLQSRYGTNLATGARVTVAHIEASESTNSPTYLPATNQFLGKTFTIKSDPGGVSSHATTVGSFFYGGNSTAPGTTNIHAYEANGFIGTDLLRATQSQPYSALPLNPSPARVLNNSWIGLDSVAPPYSSFEYHILRRTDYVVDTFRTTVVGGLNNSAGSLDYSLLSQGYNSIAVGVSGGNSPHGPTLADVAGRAKPDIVAPNDLTSWGTALVSGSATLLIDRALSQLSLTNAADPRVIKALLLNAAAKLPGWHKGDPAGTDDSTVPLDWRYGAGDLRINRAYDLLNAGEVAPGTTTTNCAWDLGAVGPGITNWYFFGLDPTVHASLKATLVWHRRVTQFRVAQLPDIVLNNLNLALFSASGTNPIAPVAVSTSAIDNVEHLWVTNFAAGGYAIAVTANGAETYGIAFDAIPAPRLSITGTDTNAAEFGVDPASFLVSRDGSAELAITANLAPSGTASNGLDYAIAPSVTLTAGQTSANVTLTPIPDALAEGPEAAAVAIAPGSGYLVSATNQATATIADRPLDQWRFENFTAEELADPSISADGANPDGDGPNLVDYDSGGKPKRFEEGISGRASILSDGGLPYLSLTFQRRIPPTDVTNIVEPSGNLMDWASNAIQVGSPTPGSNGTETVTFRDTVPTTDAEHRFLRRRVERIPAP